MGHRQVVLLATPVYRYWRLFEASVWHFKGTCIMTSLTCQEKQEIRQSLRVELLQCRPEPLDNLVVFGAVVVTCFPLHLQDQIISHVPSITGIPERQRPSYLWSMYLRILYGTTDYSPCMKALDWGLIRSVIFVLHIALTYSFLLLSFMQTFSPFFISSICFVTPISSTSTTKVSYRLQSTELLRIHISELHVYGSISCRSSTQRGFPSRCFKNDLVKLIQRFQPSINAFPTSTPNFLKCIKWLGTRFDSLEGWIVSLLALSSKSPKFGLNNSLVMSVSHSFVNPPQSIPSQPLNFIRMSLFVKSSSIAKIVSNHTLFLSIYTYLTSPDFFLLRLFSFASRPPKRASKPQICSPGSVSWLIRLRLFNCRCLTLSMLNKLPTLIDNFADDLLLPLFPTLDLELFASVFDLICYLVWSADMVCPQLTSSSRQRLPKATAIFHTKLIFLNMGRIVGILSLGNLKPGIVLSFGLPGRDCTSSFGILKQLFIIQMISCALRKQLTRPTEQESCTDFKYSLLNSFILAALNLLNSTQSSSRWYCVNSASSNFCYLLNIYNLLFSAFTLSLCCPHSTLFSTWNLHSLNHGTISKHTTSICLYSFSSFSSSEAAFFMNKKQESTSFSSFYWSFDISMIAQTLKEQALWNFLKFLISSSSTPLMFSVKPFRNSKMNVSQDVGYFCSRVFSSSIWVGLSKSKALAKHTIRFQSTSSDSQMMKYGQPSDEYFSAISTYCLYCVTMQLMSACAQLVEYAVTKSISWYYFSLSGNNFLRVHEKDSSVSTFSNMSILNVFLLNLPCSHTVNPMLLLNILDITFNTLP